ncbi:MAG: amidohydrolase family protein [Candidatus Hydrogenedentota bacterium]|nr:MAG: amidohydrolase family protein [Candidatus Hydrogenedentota bacterium]
MIVDVHYHLIPMLPEEMVGQLLDDPIRALKIMGKMVDRDELIKRASERYADPTGEGVIASMEEAGIDFTCICAVDNAGNEMLTLELAQTQNKLVGEIARKHPDRLMALAGVDPRRPNAPDMLRQCFEEFGMKGLKYHADYGYGPASPESYKLLEIVQENRGLLLSHTGPLGPPSRCKFADPGLLADLAVDFPKLKVIAAHMGQINWRPWAALASHQPNLYGDLAMWDAFAFGHYELFCRELRDLIDYAGVSKVLFGTDNPIFGIVIPTRDWIQLIKDLPVKAPEGIRFTREEVDGILGGNAASLLGLDQRA